MEEVGEDNKNKRPTGDDYGDSNNPALAAAAALSESDLEMPFGYGGKENTTISASYAKLVFDVLTQGYPTPAKRNARQCGPYDGMMWFLIWQDEMRDRKPEHKTVYPRLFSVC